MTIMVIQDRLLKPTLMDQPKQQQPSLKILFQPLSGLLGDQQVLHYYIQVVGAQLPGPGQEYFHRPAII